ncbi:hypothetical protein ACG74X_19870 [Marivita sp. S0852]|uniref:hypothetical protein n=1 Tax=Marivita sp. S0852 TaxID=3373893 RepID=UPI003981B747
MIDMMTDIWDYPETDAVHSPTREHEFVVWISLEGLDPFWRSLDAIGSRADAFRDIARTVLLPYQTGTSREPVDGAFLAAIDDQLGNGARASIEGLFRTALAREDVPGFVEWEGWFSMRQHEPEITGVDPLTAVNLMEIYRAEVPGLQRKREAMLKDHLVGPPLSEWDLAIHAFYGYNYYHADRTDRSVVLTGLRQFDRAILFATFLRTHVLPLPDGVREALHAELRRDWEELLSEEAPAGLEHVMGSEDPKAEAARIPTVELVLP